MLTLNELLKYETPFLECIEIVPEGTVLISSPEGGNEDYDDNEVDW